jgi:hypothetical protein
MVTTDATRTALMAGTVLALSPPLNGVSGDRHAQTAAWPVHFTVADEPR